MLTCAKPVQSYGEEVEDGGRAAEHVAGGPDIAQQRAQDPGGADLQHSDHQRERGVCHGLSFCFM